MLKWHSELRDVSRRIYILLLLTQYVMRCAILYYLHNFQNVKNTHGGVLILVKLQAEAWNCTKINTPPWVLSLFLNCRNGTKSRNASHMQCIRPHRRANLQSSSQYDVIEFTCDQTPQYRHHINGKALKLSWYRFVFNFYY